MDSEIFHIESLQKCCILPINYYESEINASSVMDAFYPAFP